MNTTEINRNLGTKWFTFYTKVRPWISCLTAFSVLSDFIHYTDIYANYGWMLLYFIAALVQTILSIIVAIKSTGDYVGFVRFVKGVLLFETINFAYSQGVQQYIRSAFDINPALLMFIVILAISFFVWYHLNVKYFEKRIPSGSNITTNTKCSSKETTQTNSIKSSILSKKSITSHDKKIFTENTEADEGINTLLKVQVEHTIEAMKANESSHPSDENADTFGLIPENPIFTDALKSVDGEEEYLEQLYTGNGEKIKYRRLGPISTPEVNGITDIYETFLPSGQPYKTIYINMYGTKTSAKAPVGFVLEKPTPAQRPVSATPNIKKASQKTPRAKKAKYCSKCGFPIDHKTKKCTGCGKQYFRGLRLSKFSVTVIVMSLVILALSALCIFQYINTQTATSDLQAEINRLEQQVKSKESTIKTKDSTIKRLESEIDDLEDEKWDNWDKLNFFDTYAEIVPDDGTRKYHKWGCSKLDTSNGFWIFNTPAAADDYTECSYCH